MPMRRNEIEAMIRQTPFANVITYDASLNPIYEAWASPGTALSEAKWVACKRTYGSSGEMTRTQWAQDSNGVVGDFTNIATDLSTLTYV